MAKLLRERVDFGKVPLVLEVPYLVEFQKRSFERFLQKDEAPEQRTDEGLHSAFNSVFPITDYNDTASIEFISYTLSDSKLTPRECILKGLTYAAPLRIKVRLNIWEKDDRGNKRLKESREQEVYIGDMPVMTDTGSFIINGTERVIVSQLHRSPGVYFAPDKGKTHASGRLLYTARAIPARGSWLDFEFDSKDILYVRIDRRRKLPSTIVLKALGYSNEDLLRTFYPVEEIKIKGKDTFTRVVSDVLAGVRAKQNIVAAKTNEVIVREASKITKGALKKMETSGILEIPISSSDIIGRVTLADIVDPSTGEIILDGNKEITEEVFYKVISLKIETLHLLFIDNVNYLPSFRETLLTDKVTKQGEALKEIYRKLRPGEPATEDAARELFNGLFFDPKRYDLSPVGRLKVNEKLGLDVPLDTRVLTDRDIVEIVRYLLNLRTGKGEVDDIDHLGNRRIRGIGELLENHFRIGLVRMERAIKEKMTLTELESAMPHDLINAKPVMAAVKEFFGSSQLSQFMDQTNPLSEITHKRRLSALGPGGLTRERAGFEVRDVHPTHYGRICPIETPEGPNIGLISSLSCFARINDYGFIESPYRRVKGGRIIDYVQILNPGESSQKVGDVMTRGEVDKVNEGQIKKNHPAIEFEAHCDYLSAWEEDKYIIAQANVALDQTGHIVPDLVNARQAGNFVLKHRDEIEYMDVSPKQLVSVAASLIPFLENDDANRALMGSNMQRQAVPLLRAEAPYVGTGMERVTARDSGAVVICKRGGVVDSVDSERIIVRVEGGAQQEGQLSREVGADIYQLTKFKRSNQNTCISQKPIVYQGQKVKKGAVLADGPCTENGELALGRNVLV